MAVQINMKKVIKIKKKNSRNHEYFDSDYNKRKEQQGMADLLEKNPDNLPIRQSYHQTKRL